MRDDSGALRALPRALPSLRDDMRSARCGAQAAPGQPLWESSEGPLDTVRASRLAALLVRRTGREMKTYLGATKYRRMHTGTGTINSSRPEHKNRYRYRCRYRKSKKSPLVFLTYVYHGTAVLIASQLQYMYSCTSMDSPQLSMLASQLSMLVSTWLCSTVCSTYNIARVKQSTVMAIHVAIGDLFVRAGTRRSAEAQRRSVPPLARSRRVSPPRLLRACRSTLHPLALTPCPISHERAHQAAHARGRPLSTRLILTTRPVVQAVHARGGPATTRLVHRS